MTGAPAEQPGGFEEALAALDTSLFGYVRSQTSQRDRISLLAVQNALREVYGRFTYLEIGSHLGGSLQALVADERCTSITSIDSRPLSQPDVRGIFDYPGNTTERMMERLELVPGADLTKLHTIEASTDELAPESLPTRPHLCMIDAEHTEEAALRDARFCRHATGEDGAIVFHDRRLIRAAIERFLEELGDLAHEGYPLLGSIYVLELGPTRLRPTVQDLMAGQEETKPFLMDHPARRYPPA